MLEGIGRDLDAVLYFDLPDEVAIERLLGRARAEGRTDDAPDVGDAVPRIRRVRSDE